MAHVHLELVGAVQLSKLLSQVAYNLNHKQERHMLFKGLGMRWNVSDLLGLQSAIYNKSATRLYNILSL